MAIGRNRVSHVRRSIRRTRGRSRVPISRLDAAVDATVPIIAVPVRAIILMIFIIRPTKGQRKTITANRMISQDMLVVSRRDTSEMYSSYW